jgi:hypothetical protein
MAHVAITVEGGLFAADLLDRIGATPDEIAGQGPADFGLDRTRLSGRSRPPSLTSYANGRHS